MARQGLATNWYELRTVDLTFHYME